VAPLIRSPRTRRQGPHMARQVAAIHAIGGICATCAIAWHALSSPCPCAPPGLTCMHPVFYLDVLHGTAPSVPDRQARDPRGQPARDTCLSHASPLRPPPP